MERWRNSLRVNWTQTRNHRRGQFSTWTPPRMQAKSWESSVRSRILPSVRPRYAPPKAAGLYESYRTEPHHPGVLASTVESSGLRVSPSTPTAASHFAGFLTASTLKLANPNRQNGTKSPIDQRFSLLHGRRNEKSDLIRPACATTNQSKAVTTSPFSQAVNSDFESFRHPKIKS